MRFSKYLAQATVSSKIMIMVTAGIGRRNGTRYIVRKKPAEKQNPERPDLRTLSDDLSLDGEKSLSGILRAKSINAIEMAIAQIYCGAGATKPVSFAIENVSRSDIIGNITNAAKIDLRCRSR